MNWIVDNVLMMFEPLVKNGRIRSGTESHFQLTY